MSPGELAELAVERAEWQVAELARDFERARQGVNQGLCPGEITGAKLVKPTKSFRWVLVPQGSGQRSTAQTEFSSRQRWLITASIANRSLDVD